MSTRSLQVDGLMEPIHAHVDNIAKNAQESAKSGELVSDSGASD